MQVAHTPAVLTDAGGLSGGVATPDSFRFQSASTCGYTGESHSCGPSSVPHSHLLDH